MKEFSDAIKQILDLPTSECVVALKQQYDEKGAFAILEALGASFGNAPQPSIVQKLVSFVQTYYPQEQRPVRTIGVFYNNINIGGVQRVIISQFPIFKQLGIKIVFFTGMCSQENEFSLPDYVKLARMPIPNALQPDFPAQLKECAAIIQAENIDVFYSHDIYENARLIWLPLIVKTIFKVPFFIHYHTIFSKQILRGLSVAFSLQNELLRFADLLITQSTINQLYFSISGINSICIPNQYFLPETTVSPKEKAAAHTILFLSRIDCHKRPISAIRILEHVIKEMPSAKLLIVGGGTEDEENILKAAIAESEAADHIEFCGPTLDVVSFYQQADVFLITSSHEGFLLTLLEAQTFGLPIVCYDLPYLEIIRQPDNGIITVPQEAPLEAAKAVVQVLTDEELYRKKARAGVATAEYFAKIDLVGQWQKILTGWQCVATDAPLDFQNTKILLDTMRLHIYWGGKSVGRDLEKAKYAAAKLKKSVTYRLGLVFTWLPITLLKACRLIKKNGFACTCHYFWQKLRCKK